MALIVYGASFRDNMSDSSSTSQTSYDPNRPMFAGMSAEIPDSIATSVDDSTSSGITLVSAKPRGEAGNAIIHVGVCVRARVRACVRVCACVHIW